MIFRGQPCLSFQHLLSASLYFPKQALPHRVKICALLWIGKRQKEFGAAVNIGRDTPRQPVRDPALDIPTVEQQLREIQRNVQSREFAASYDRRVNAVFRLDGEIVGFDREGGVAFFDEAAEFLSGDGRSDLERER